MRCDAVRCDGASVSTEADLFAIYPCFVFSSEKSKFELSGWLCSGRLGVVRHGVPRPGRTSQFQVMYHKLGIGEGVQGLEGRLLS